MHNEYRFKWKDYSNHVGKCENCGAEVSGTEGPHNPLVEEYYFSADGHIKGVCSDCGGRTTSGSLDPHDWYEYHDGYIILVDEGVHAKSCMTCGYIEETTKGSHDSNGNDGTCSVCGYNPNCESDEPCTPAPVEEDKKEEKEDKKESSSSSSSSKQTYSAPVTAETIRAAEGVTGSKEFVAKQTTMTTTVNNTIAALNNLAAINPAQANVLKNIGISLNAGGCTSFNANTAATLIKNNSIPYNLAFTWKNISFRVVIPKGANLSELVDPVTGQLYFYKLVQKYGVAGCTLIK